MDPTEEVHHSIVSDDCRQHYKTNFFGIRFDGSENWTVAVRYGIPEEL